MRYDVITNSEAKGLFVEVLRGALFGDCTADGASSRYDEFTLVEIVRESFLGNEVTPMPEGSRVFAATEKRPAARLVHRNLNGRGIWHVEPIVDAPQQPWLMAGGNYAAQGDSRISEITGVYGALSIHDRKEA